MEKEQKKDVLYQQNPMRKARSAYDQTRHQSWQPEYERLNVEPHYAQDFSEDLRFRRPNYEKPVSGGHSAASRHISGTPMRQMRLPQQPVNITGMNHENAWMEGQTPAEYSYDAVPDPPPTPFTHAAAADPRMNASQEGPMSESPPFQKRHSEETRQPLSKVLDGEYCVFVSGNLLFSTPSLEEAEDALNRLIFSDNPVPVEEVIVMKRLGLKIGASIG